MTIDLSVEDVLLIQRALVSYEHDFTRAIEAGIYAPKPAHFEEQRAAQDLLQRLKKHTGSPQ